MQQSAVFFKITKHSPHLILPTARFSEVCDRREFGMDGLSIKPSIVQIDHSLLGIFFIAELQNNRDKLYTTYK